MVKKVVKGVVIGSAIGAAVAIAECGFSSKKGSQFGKRLMRFVGL